MTASANWIEIPDQFDYTKAEVHAFSDDLEAMHGTMLRTPISEPDDILLKPDGRLRTGNWKLSLLAVRQLCTLMASGLWQYVADVGGILRRKPLSPEAISPGLAIDTINSSINIRFGIEGGLSGRHMIIDGETDIVDGIVGIKYKYLAHAQLYEIVVDLLAGAEVPAEFYAATRIGRLISMEFLQPAPFMEYKGVPFYAGYYFRNSEAGEGGVRAAFIVHYGTTNMRCMSSLLSCPHVGRAFVSKLGRTLTRTIDAETKIAPLQANAKATLDMPLPLRKPDGSIDTKYYKLLVKTLNLAGAENSFMETAVSKTELHEDPITVGDLFFELVSCAAWLHPRDREKVEHVAYQVLTNKLELEEL
jgi:hypothetical protein